MLLEDFFFSIKNVHISYFKRRKIIKLFKIGLVFLYKFMKQTIALIDDDRNILTSISIALEKEGFKRRVACGVVLYHQERHIISSSWGRFHI